MHALLLAAVIGQFVIPNTPLAREITVEWPELKSVETDWERVNILRGWAWAHTDFVHRKSCGQDTDNRFHIGWPICPPNQDYTPAHFYGQFAHDKGAVWVPECCLGLAALYRSFGYRAEYIALAESFFGPNHHGQVLVEIEHRGRKIIVLQDPTFNISFTDRLTLEPLDYFEIVRRLAKREHTSIRAVGPDYTQMPAWPRVYFPDEFVEGRPEKDLAKNFWPIMDDVSMHEEVNGNILFHSPRTLEKWLRVEAHDSATGQPRGILAYLVDLGYPPDWMYLHLRVKGITKHSRPHVDWQERQAELAGQWKQEQN